MQDYLQLVISRIKANKSLSKIKGAMELHIKQENKAEFYSTQREEYEVLWPAYRNMTDEEKISHDTIVDELGEDTVIEREEDYIYPQVRIEYITADEDGNEIRTPAEYITYEEYKNETRVVQEAVYESQEVVHSSENNTVVTYEDVLVTPEVTELVRPYIPVEVTDEMIQAELDKLAEYKEYLSKQKQDKLNNLYVTVNDKVFDAHLEARLNMATAIQASSLTNQTETQWKMYDNSVQTVTVGELQQALILALTEVGKTIGAIDESTN
jgi:ribosomal protein S11